MKYRAGSRRRAREYEQAILEFWEKDGTFEKSVEQRDVKNSYVFYDGPPFITGNPHHGTLLSSIVKDAVPRFWTMRGKRCERRWGWDCHGLPAENYVEKQLGITDRREIGVKWSLEDYIRKARESMVANSETWKGTIARVGRWVDFEGAYRTMDKDFMESVWWAFATLYEAGKIYEGRKVLMYDTRFATPVSKAEVTMDNDAYQTVTDPSAYVKFKVVGGEQLGEIADLTGGDDLYLLAWTTTPWTLPANLCLAVNPEMEYGVYEVEGEWLILGCERAKVVLPGVEAKRTLAGTELVGLEYEPIIETVRPEERAENTYRVLGAEFVGDAEGTGVVHCAPAYGEDDYELGQKMGVDFVDCIDENGYYLPEMRKKLHDLGVRDTDETGIEIWAGNKFIAKVLEEKGVVWKIEYIQHEYPFNPRSKQRVMYRAFPSWFFDVQGMKPLMIEQNENVNWFPKHLKEGRFKKNIEAAPDWNLSRDRFWATAMPVWKGDKGAVKVVGSYEELYELSGVKLDDYHRPWVDAIEFDGYVSKNGEFLGTKKVAGAHKEHFKRIEKVLDCWFESGSMPFAQLHYPFENKEKFERNYPADFIVEYVAQVRAWFYYVHCVNTALAEVGGFGEKVQKGAKNAYRNVITTGTLAGNDGRKMSKSLGNYTDPNELMDKYSADSLRFLLLSSPVLSGEDFSLLDKDVSDVARKLAMIWNVYDFFCMYAEVDKVDSSEIEAWLENNLNHNVRVEDLSAGAGFGADPGGHTGAGTPHPQPGDLLDGSQTNPALSRQILNPLDRYILSRIHQLRDEITVGMEEYNLPKALGGVLTFVDDLSNWFVRRSRRRFWKSEDDDDKMEAYATLYYVLVYLSKIIAPFVPFLAEELYQQMTGSGESVHLLDWPEAGDVDVEVLEQMGQTREIITEGLALRMRKSETEEQVKVRQPLAKLVYTGERLPEFYEQIIAEEVNVKKVEQGEEMMLNKKLTQALREEGFVRELVRFVQAGRKKAGLLVDDRIKLSASCGLNAEQREILARETLAEVIDEGNYEHDEIVTVNGERVTISLEKV